MPHYTAPASQKTSLRHRPSNWYESGYLSKHAKSDECFPLSAKHVDQVHSTLVWSEPQPLFLFIRQMVGGDPLTQPGEDAAGIFDPCTSSSPPNILMHWTCALIQFTRVRISPSFWCPKALIALTCTRSLEMTHPSPWYQNILSWCSYEKTAVSDPGTSGRAGRARTQDVWLDIWALYANNVDRCCCAKIDVHTFLDKWILFFILQQRH